MPSQTKLPILSIDIPTYNRLEYLKQTIEVLLPQITDDVEIVVSDNCSTDGTWPYLETLEGQVQRFRHERNVGADQNIFTCLKLGTAQYVWILCDDDLPCINTVDRILDAITAFQAPPILFVKSVWRDLNLSDYDKEPVHTGWVSLDRNRFLETLSYWFSVGSSIVVRRDCVDVSFIKRCIGTSLTPAAITLSTVGLHNEVIVSEQPLVVCRSYNSGGYDGLTVFTRNLSELLQSCAWMGFDRAILKKTYEETLRNWVVSYVRRMSLKRTGVLNLFRSSYRFKSFYTTVLPALLAVFLRRCIAQMRSIFRFLMATTSGFFILRT